MFNLSIYEIIIILLAVIIFVKPEDIPEMLKKAGRMIRSVKRYTTDLLSDFDDEDEKPVKPKSKITGLDGEEHDAYDVHEVFYNNDKNNNPENKS